MIKWFRQLKENIYNLITFFPVVWKFRPYDYWFLMELEKTAMLEMRNYYEQSHIVISDVDSARYLRLAVNLLRQIDKVTDYWVYEYKVNQPILYINMKNAPKGSIWEKKANDRMFQYDWYEEKCWRLYWKIREEKTKSWWN